MLSIRSPLIRGIKQAVSSSRQLHVGTKLCSAKQSPLFLLRQKTGLAYNLCREALNKHNDNVEEAEAWLKAQAMALGLEKVNKVGSRTTGEGLFCVANESSHKEVHLIQVNCETDFVAKNQYFRDFVLDLTQKFASMKQDFALDTSLKEKFISQLNPNSEIMEKLNADVVPLISKMGENIRINNATSFCGITENVGLFGKVHSKVASKVSDNLDISAGKFCAIVGLQDLNEDSQLYDLSRLRVPGNILCQHVIGYNPSYIELPESIRKHLEEAQQEKADRLKELEEMEQRKEKKKKKVVEEEKEESQEVKEGEEEEEEEENIIDAGIDWPSLMDQKLIISDEHSVREYCQQNNISVVYFQRFEC